MPLLKNKRHEIFAGLVANTGNARQAYISAGYSANGADASASKLLKSTKVAARVAELREFVIDAVTNIAVTDKAWVISQLIENVKMAKTPEIVYDNEGAATGEVKLNLPAANKALELIGKEFGMFIDRKEVRTGNLLDEVPHDELKELERMLRADRTGSSATLASAATGTKH